MRSSRLILLSSAVVFACSIAPTSAPLQAALLATSSSDCLAEISSAAGHLTGHPVILAADAFVRHDSVPLSSSGQSADGRMLRPAEVLQLRIALDGCKLGLAGGENRIDVRSCNCRAAVTPFLN